MDELSNKIILNDENGNEIEFEFLDLIEYKGNEYVVLLPCDNEEETEVVVLQVEDLDGNWENYLSVDDDATVQAVFEIFKNKFAEEFNFADESDADEEVDSVEDSRQEKPENNLFEYVMAAPAAGMEQIYAACGAVIADRSKNAMTLVCADGADTTDYEAALKTCVDDAVHVFTEGLLMELIGGFKDGTYVQIREKYAQCEMLILSGLQVLFGRENTQIEIKNILSKRLQAGKTTVVFTERSMQELKDNLSNALFSLLSGGMVAQRNTDRTERQVKPYNGSKPYIFVSYSHRNTPEVLEIICRLQEEGYRVWYDEGIDPGTEWDEYIARRVENCGFFLAFISEEYLRSENCRDELNFARDQGKGRLLVYLTDVKLKGGMAMRLNRLQAIHKYTYSTTDAFMKKLTSATQLAAFKE